MNLSRLTKSDRQKTDRYRYQRRFAFAPEAYVITDAQGTIQAINVLAEAWFNLTADHAVGTSLSQWVRGADRDTLAACVEQAQTPTGLPPGGRRFVLEMQTPSGDPRPTWVSVAQAPGHGSRDLYWLLRESPPPDSPPGGPSPSLTPVPPTPEVSLNQIVKKAGIAITGFRVYANGDWAYDHWSTGCEQVFGYDASHYTDKTFWMEQVHPEDRVQYLQPLWADFYAEREVTVEYRFRHADGTFHWYLSTYTSLRVAEDCWLVTAISCDITDRKQAALVLHQQIQQEYLLNEITQDICHFRDLEDLLGRTVERSRGILESDRVLIFRLLSPHDGYVMAEAVARGLEPLLGATFHDPCLAALQGETLPQGWVRAIPDLDQGGLDPCYAALLRRYQVRASLVVPIFQGGITQGALGLGEKEPREATDRPESLWGLLIVHQCRSSRPWQPAEIALLKRIAAKASVAIQQSDLYGQMRQHLLQREHIQQILQQSEARFDTLSAAAPIGIGQLDREGRCVYLNARWQHISGLNAEASLGRGWLRGVYPADRSRLLQAWRQYRRGGLSQRWSHTSHRFPEFRLTTPAGDLRWVAVAIAPLTTGTGEVGGYVSTIEDISDRKEAEDKIREQATLLDIASDAIFVRDLSHRICYWNRGAERLYGWSAAEALGQPCYHLLRGDLPYLDSVMEILLDQGEWQGEIDEVTKGGDRIMVAARWTLVRDEAHQPKYILSVETDITEKKTLQVQFFQAQRLESLGRLASGIAHDLNNMLTPILTMTQMLRDTDTLAPMAQESLRLIEDSARRGSHMVQQILALTRRHEDRKTVVHVGALLADLTTVLGSSLPKTIAIDLNLPPTLAPIQADPTHLHQVFMNLCINARDAMPTGGTLTLTAEPVTLAANRLMPTPTGDYVRVTVADTGTGIDPAIQDRIFDPFFTTKDLGDGNGLGLTTVIAIVKDTGGFVQVASEVGQGTQIQVYLPVIPATDQIHRADRPSSPMVANPQQGQGQLILVVDDDPTVQRTTQALLEKHHYRTLTANNGQDALRFYTKHQDAIQLVIIDMMMPIMDGATLIQHLCALNPAVKTIAISGLPAYRETALTAGASAFFAKPYDLGNLLRTLATLVQAEGDPQRGRSDHRPPS